jgi:hypothetical protein
MPGKDLFIQSVTENVPTAILNLRINHIVISYTTMKKLLISILLLFTLLPYSWAEQCKGCNFTTGVIMTFLVLAALACLACALIVAVLVFYLLNNIQPAKRKNVGLTYGGAIAGGALGLIANFTHLLRSGQVRIMIYAFFCLFVGSAIGYFLTTKKKLPPVGQQAKNEPAKNGDVSLD